MSLSCSCDYEPGPGDVMWDSPADYSTLNTKRIRKCCSCGERIPIGSIVAAFPRYKVPEYDVEVSIYGETDECGPPRSTQYMCEQCADLYFSLSELGFCLSIYDDMREVVREYAELYGKSRATPAGDDR